MLGERGVVALCETNNSEVREEVRQTVFWIFYVLWELGVQSFSQGG